jgi:ATP-GRASP peptide maturase of grasp-with-spasm system
MILLISQSEYEYTTDIVFDWIKHLGGNVVRLNGSDLLNEKAIKLEMSNNGIKLEINNLKLDDINIIWYRRWIDSFFSFDNNKETNTYLAREFKGLSQFIFNALINHKWYNRNNHLTPYPSKAEQLNWALKCDILIPETLICSTKSEVLDFYIKNNRKIISKNIFEVGVFFEENKIKSTFTHQIDESNINNIPDAFYPSLFQEDIKKKFEIRVFFNKGVCNSMAIFSGRNDKTKSDFRNYDMENPNRNVPIKLPKSVEEKIEKLMAKLDLETGSLDYIYTDIGEYIFLEVNPLGQFGMVSIPCNYYLEKKIAQELIELDKK